MSRKSGCAAGLILGSALRLLALILEFFIRLIANLLVFFGLWVPFLYSILGLCLYFFLDFNPLDWDLEGQLYFAGLAVCLVCSGVITIRNLVLKPAKSVVKGYKEPLWKKDREKKVKKDMRAYPSETLREEIEERPNIYYSAIEEDTLIHEYSDRFEIFRLHDNRAKLDRIEYKDNYEK